MFYNTDCLFILYELLYNFPDNIIGIELAALTLNLTTYPENAKKLASSKIYFLKLNLYRWKSKRFNRKSIKK
jgi:hypothetical protein